VLISSWHCWATAVAGSAGSIVCSGQNSWAVGWRVKQVLPKFHLALVMLYTVSLSIWVGWVVVAFAVLEYLM
jgi:hypothetical protein